MPAGAGRPGALTAREVSYATFVAEWRGSLLRTALLLGGGDVGRAEPLLRRALTRLYLVWPWVGPHGPVARARQLLLDAAIAEDARPRGDAGEPSRRGADGSPAPTGPDLLRALAELPPRTRLAVVLRDVEHLGEAEAADVLGCSRHTLRGLAADGHQQLRSAVPPSLPPAAATPPTPRRPTMTDPELTLLLRGAVDRLRAPATGPDDVAGDVDRGRRTLTLVRRRRAVRPGRSSVSRLPDLLDTRPPAGAGS